MPPRPPPLPWTRTSCLGRASAPRLALHTTSPRLAAESPSHYDTLQLSPTATAVEIKRQFYALSKKHHPDRNRSDPTASTRFVAISEAYHTLSVPEKRTQYDAQLRQSQSPTSRWASHPHPEGSYSSASFGARPASGLNKRRTTFRGPPPSFYKTGGYGQHGEKRAEYAHHDPHVGRQAAEDAGQGSYGDYGGFGPGQQRQGSEVPHFDTRRHKETHDSINAHIYARRRRARINRVDEINRGGVVMNFMLISGAIGFIGFTANILGNRNEKISKKKDGS